MPSAAAIKWSEPVRELEARLSLPHARDVVEVRLCTSLEVVAGPTAAQAQSRAQGEAEREPALEPVLITDGVHDEPRRASVDVAALVMVRRDDARHADTADVAVAFRAEHHLRHQRQLRSPEAHPATDLDLEVAPEGARQRQANEADRRICPDAESDGGR